MAVPISRAGPVCAGATAAGTRDWTVTARERVVTGGRKGAIEGDYAMNQSCRLGQDHGNWGFDGPGRLVA
jgi:hypothetical protein